MGQMMRAAAGFETTLTEHHVCLFCDSNCTAKEELVQCYDCGQWAHQKCAGLTELQYNSLVGANDTIQWVCRKCLARHVEQRRWLEAQLDELIKQVKHLSERVEILEKNHAGETTVAETKKEADRNPVKTVPEKVLIKDESLTVSDTTESRETNTVGRERGKEEKMTKSVERMNSMLEEEREGEKEEKVTKSVERMSNLVLEEEQSEEEQGEEEQGEKSIEEEMITESVERMSTVDKEVLDEKSVKQETIAESVERMSSVVVEEPAKESVQEEKMAESVERMSTVVVEEPAKESVQEEEMAESVERMSTVDKEEPAKESVQEEKRAESGERMSTADKQEPAKEENATESVGKRNLVLKEEPVEQSGDQGETGNSEYAELKCDDQRPSEQTVDSEPPDPTLLRYSREELLQIAPAPLTADLTLRLLYLGISGDYFPKKVYCYENTASLFKLKYSRVDLLRIAPAQPSPELISHLLSLGISADPPRRRRQHIDTEINKPEPEGPCEGQQPRAMPSPQSGNSAGQDGSFACFLCEAGGFTAEGMEQHLRLCHGDRAEEGQGSTFSCPMCSFTTARQDEHQTHLDTQHPEQLVTLSDVSNQRCCQSQQSAVAGTSSDVDGVDADGCILETSLRLNDGPDEEEGEEVTGQGEDLNNEDGLPAEVDGKEEAGGEGAPGELSNLSVILCSEQNQDDPLPELDPGVRHSPENTAQAHHGGARPKVRPTPPAGCSVWPETTPPDQQASSSSVEGGDREGRRFSCPLCPFRTKSEFEIEKHVSQQHLMEEDGEEATKTAISCMHACPFCGSKFDMPVDLSIHVNARHPDGNDTGGGWVENVGSQDPASSEASEGGRMDGGQQCPVCGLWCSEAFVALHVNQHFASSTEPAVLQNEDMRMALQLHKEEEERRQEENNKFKTIQTRYGMDSTMTAKQQFDKDLDQAVAKGQITASEFHEKKTSQAQSRHSGIDDGSTQVSGVVERLQQFYSSKNCPGAVRKAHLCSSVNHYSSSFGDKGWGCGYRNLQMVLSCLMNNPTYLQVLFNGKAKIPSILKLQQLIEAAWQKGFDPQGRQQLGGSVVNTRKWIGATEVVAMLSSLHVKCRLVDFVKPSGPNNTHPVMLQWVRDYFTSSTPFKPPLYLQHQGHSRTIVGVEELTNGNTNLLLFDPGVAKTRMEQFHSGINHKLLQTIRKTTNAFKARQYQILAVVGVLSDQEYEKSKIIQSERKG